MNIITATFPPGCTQITAAAEVWQWDQGQILQINGIDLPDAFQVEFSNYAVRGQAAPMIGGPDGVEIPDVYLTTGLPVFAFIVLHTGEDDRETEYRITIPVIARPEPTDVEPTPEQQGVIDQLIAALDAGVGRAEDAADAAEAALEEFTTPTATAETLPAGSSASASYENGNFNFGIPRGADGADGADGVSPEVTVTTITGGHSVTITDADHPTGQSFDVMDGAPGQTGATPDFSIGTVSTLPAGSDATASITGTAEEPVLNLGIPKGDTGADGVSPEVSIATITGGHSVTITDADHPSGQTFDVMDGEVTQAEVDAMYPVDSASGAIASFSDGAAKNAVALSAAINPVQDLHGYENPWPAGGGINKLPSPTAFDETITDIRFQCDGNGKYVISGTSGGSRTLSKEIQEITLPNEDIYLHLLNNEANSNVSIFFFNGTTQVAGLTFGQVNRIYKLTALSGATINKINIVVAPGQTVNITATPMLLTTNAVTAYSPYSNICPITGWTGANIHVSPTTDAADGTTYSISFPSEAGTVYGGTLDVTSGVLTADYAIAEYDGSSDESWVVIDADTRAYIAVPDIKTPPTNQTLMGILSNEYKEGVYYNYQSQKPMICARSNITQINVFDTRITSSTDWKAFLAANPLQVIYPLATPVEYTLTPTEVQLLLGENNVWADTGDTTVTYKADIQKYIDKKIAAAVAAL